MQATLGREKLATATVEEGQLLKTLRWWDGFVIALCNPGFLLGALGFTLGIFGVVGSMILWGASASIGMLQSWIYSEPATMFGHRSGGISLYAHEGWRTLQTLVGPLVGVRLLDRLVGRALDLRQDHRRPRASRSGSRTRPGP